MGTTATFLKLRSEDTPKLGEWNINYSKALSLAKKNNKFLILVWSNGDKCGYCTSLEKVFMEKTFTDWMAKSDCYYVFQYSGDKDKGKTLHDLIYCKESKLKYYPGIMIVTYDPKDTSKVTIKKFFDGNTLRGSKTGAAGAKNVIANIEKIISLEAADTDGGEPKVDYKIRLNEKLTVAKVNKILDAIDANGGYCPCQPKGAGTRCHCEDFLKNKKVGEPCICKIYVKKAKPTKKAGAAPEDVCGEPKKARRTRRAKKA